ncbi:unnamed protein product [Cylindrotheca closterium]|uniref:G-protein coupled receptors family 2 profile 2 domain-containing protein n=1 Tax=Cylindrotheca closterium TaxID=2856 RepID=A0AAD2FWN6_9STRA|nr:unnamed protein product [Cylindrotheca closterium]
MALSRQQRVWLAILPKISSVFSLFGSLWIIIEVTTEGRKIQNPYHRLLLAMSIYDTLESFWNFGSTWPIVEGSPDIIWAMGNVSTCEAQGFFLTLSVAVPIYNAMLSIYYILVINYRYTNTQLRRRVEPIMHLIAFFWSFGTASYSAATGLFNNANLWCWIAPLPLDCKDTITYGTVEEGNDNPCIRGDNVWIYRFGFYFIPLWSCIFFATACTLWVYRYVYNTDKRTLAYRRPETAGRHTSWWSNNGETSRKSKIHEASSTLRSSDKSKTPSVDSGGNQSQSSSSIGKRIDLSGSVRDVYPDDSEDDDEYLEDLNDGKDKKDTQKCEHDDKSVDSKSTLDSIDEEKVFREIDVLVASNRGDYGPNDEEEEKREESYAFGDLNDSNSGDEDEDEDPRLTNSTKSETRKNTIRAKVDEWKNRRVQYAEDMPRTYEVFKQACYYLGAFYCTHVWSTSNRIVQTIMGGGTVFPLIACHSFFDPLQGFLNYLVYQRPRIQQLRKKHPEMSWWGVMVESLRFSFMDDASRRGSKSFGSKSFGE